MQLYAGPTRDFVHAATHNAIARRLADAFLAHYRYAPSHNEYLSWQNSLRALSSVIEIGRLHETGIVLEYQLPLSSLRLDALITGSTGERSRAVIVELKQWSASQLGSADDLLKTWVGGDHRDVLHPSAQANQYRRYLADCNEAFQGPARVSLDACAYLHNYAPVPSDPLLDARSETLRGIAPVFTGADTTSLAEHLSERLSGGDDGAVLKRVTEGRFRPAKKLLEHVAKVVADEPAFVLLDDQQVVFSQVFATVQAAVRDGSRHVFIVHGGPGTGKSVLAVNLLGALSAAGYNARHATGSKAFTTTLQRILGARAASHLHYFHQFAFAQPAEIDVLICDEAHRVRASSNHQYTRRDRRSTRPQVEELVEAAKVCVFFVDDEQVVRPNEVGSSALFRDEARRTGRVLHERVLEAQFRCSGSAGFMNWVDNTLGIRKTANVLFDQAQESFEFRIVDTPEELDVLIRQKAADGQTARLTAGYCWPWSTDRDEDGGLRKDVRIGNFERPWNARPEMTRLPKGIPTANLWAHQPGGLDQVGCIYTAQGFEFDYVGVIWGRDLRFDPGSSDWTADREHLMDRTVRNAGDAMLALLKRTYRVLLSRGMKGCYVYFEDEATRNFVRSRTEHLGAVPVAPPEATPPSSVAVVVDEGLDTRPFTALRPREAKPWVNAVPLLDLRIAAGDFSDVQSLEEDAVQWVALADNIRVAPGMFVAQVVGESMNRKVPNGAWGLFTTEHRGSRQGRVVLAERNELGDPEESGRFTLKTYDARKREGADGIVYDAVTLRPDSSDSRYKPIEIDLEDPDRPRIVAVFIAALA
jgi:DUF2075 family protein